MATGIENYPNITAPDSDYPNGNIKDDAGADDGTPVNKLVYADMHQTLAKMMREAGLTPNGLPDNEYNGFQYLEALKMVSRPYKSYVATGCGQVGTNDPTTGQIIENQIGNIVFTRQGVGSYQGFLLNAFPTSVLVYVSARSTTGYVSAQYRASVNGFVFETRDFTGALSDDVLTVFTIEVKAYY